ARAPGGVGRGGGGWGVWVGAGRCEAALVGGGVVAWSSRGGGNRLWWGAGMATLAPCVSPRNVETPPLPNRRCLHVTRGNTLRGETHGLPRAANPAPKASSVNNSP